MDAKDLPLQIAFDPKTKRSHPEVKKKPEMDHCFVEPRKLMPIENLRTKKARAQFHRLDLQELN